MKDQKEVEYGGPKYKSQLKIFERMIVVFDKAIKERELLLNNQIAKIYLIKMMGVLK